MRFTRYQMYKQLFDALPLPLTGEILGISGLKYFLGSKNVKLDREVISSSATITEATYPDVSILKLPYESNSFDVVISDQVLEHVEGDPKLAVEETHRVLKPGGLAIHTSVCIQPIHFGPKDLWRFTPDGLRNLCGEFSEIVTCDSWGNRWAQALFFLKDSARDWQIPERKLSFKHHFATLNDPTYPLTVWIVAKK